MSENNNFFVGLLHTKDNETNLPGEMLDATEFQKLLNKNVDSFIESSEQDKIDSFKIIIYDKIIEASRIGRTAVTIDTQLLYRYDLFKNFYFNECTSKGLKWDANRFAPYADISFERTK
jgi:hypothetical protein